MCKAQIDIEYYNIVKDKLIRKFIGWLFPIKWRKWRAKIRQLQSSNIMQNKKACHPSTLARKATRTLRLDFFFELILKINNPQLRLATTWPLHSGRP